MESELITNLKDIFELATNAASFTKELLDIKGKVKKSDKEDEKITSKSNSAQIGSSGDYAQIGSSGYSAKIGSSGNSAQIGSSGNSAQIGSSGNSAQIGSSGDSAKIGSSGDSAKIGSSGNSAKIGSSGDSAKIGSSGDSAKIGSSGNYAKIGSSGNYAKIGSSGYYAQIDSSGINAVIMACGFASFAKAQKGSWITLAEYKCNKDGRLVVDFVKTEQVDGENIKENVYYTLCNKTFREVEIIDNTPTIILKRRANILKTRILGELKDSFVFTKDGVNAHGETVRQAYLDWLFKTSPRDVEQYRNLDKTEVKPLDYWVLAYRTITGACSLGTNNFLNNNKDKVKKQMTLSEVLTATEGQYGANTFREFFEKE